MNRLLVSEAKTSVRTSSWLGSVSSATSTVISSDVPTAAAVSARNVRVVRSLMSSARSSGGHVLCSVSSKKASSSERV